MNPVATKRSPIVLIRMLVCIELLAVAAYFLAAAFGSYEYEIYPSLSLNRFLSFQTAKFLFVSGGQFVITLYAFLRWYRESYTVEEGAVSHKKGVFWRREKKFFLDPAGSWNIRVGPLGKWLHYGSIRIENSKGEIDALLKDIPSPHHFLESIHQFRDEEIELVELLKREENGELEFKSSLRFDHGINRASPHIERSAMKTIAAFLNSRGGSIVLGVNDERRPVGLHHDFQTLQRKDRDGFENHFTQTFNAMIGPEFRSLVHMKFETINGAEVCRVQVRPSLRPVYFAFEQNEHFYVRTGNITTSLKLREVESYIRSRWPNHRP